MEEKRLLESIAKLDMKLQHLAVDQNANDESFNTDVPAALRPRSPVTTTHHHPYTPSNVVWYEDQSNLSPRAASLKQSTLSSIDALDDYWLDVAGDISTQQSLADS